MRASQILLVAVFSIGMGVGQLLLKFAAGRQVLALDQGIAHRLLRLLMDWAFLLGAASYALLLVYWVWLLTFLPLSRAYPFTLLSLIVATIGGAIFFQEQLSLRFIIGLLIICIGLIVLGTE